jgi:hypothetical protein
MLMATANLKNKPASDRTQEKILGYNKSINLKGVILMDRDKRLILSILSHGAIFFSATLVAIGIPIKGRGVLEIRSQPPKTSTIVSKSLYKAVNW